MSLLICFTLIYLGIFIDTTASKRQTILLINHPNYQDMHYTFQEEDGVLCLNVTWKIQPPDVFKKFTAHIYTHTFPPHEYMKSATVPEIVFKDIHRGDVYFMETDVFTKMKPYGQFSNSEFYAPGPREEAGPVPETMEFKALANENAEKYIVVFLSGDDCALVVYDKNTKYEPGYTIEGTTACKSSKPYLVATLPVFVTPADGRFMVSTTIPTKLLASFPFTPKMVPYAVVDKSPIGFTPTIVYYKFQYVSANEIIFTLNIHPPATHPDFFENFTVEYRQGDKLLETVHLTKKEDASAPNTFTRAQFVEAQEDVTKGLDIISSSKLTFRDRIQCRIYTNNNSVYTEAFFQMTDYDPLLPEYVEVSAVGTNYVTVSWGDNLSPTPKPVLSEVTLKAKAPYVKDGRGLAAGTARTVTVEHLAPYQNYHVYHASTYIDGSVRKHDLGEIRTLETSPYPVQSLICQQEGQWGGLVAICSWSPPEIMNGVLRHYIVSIADSAPTKTNATSMTILDRSYHFTKLYAFRVAAVTVETGRYKGVYITLKIKGYPIEAAKVVGAKLLSAPPSSTPIDKKTQRSLFVNMEAINQDKYSPISRIIVLVAEFSLNGTGGDLPTYSDYVTNEDTKHYGLTIYEADGWLHKTLKDKIITLGEDVGEIQPGHKFNGPLKMETKYSTCIRICTLEGCSDSDAMSFETSGKTTITTTEPPLSGTSEGLSGGATAGIVIACIVGILLVVFLVLFMLKRKRRKSNEQMNFDIVAEHVGPVTVDTASVNPQQAVPQPENEIGIRL